VCVWCVCVCVCARTRDLCECACVCVSFPLSVCFSLTSVPPRQRGNIVQRFSLDSESKRKVIALVRHSVPNVFSCAECVLCVVFSVCRRRGSTAAPCIIPEKTFCVSSSSLDRCTFHLFPDCSHHLSVSPSLPPPIFAPVRVSMHSTWTCVHTLQHTGKNTQHTHEKTRAHTNTYQGSRTHTHTYRGSWPGRLGQAALVSDHLPRTEQLYARQKAGGRASLPPSLLPSPSLSLPCTGCIER